MATERNGYIIMKKIISLILSAAVIAANAVIPAGLASASDPNELTLIKSDSFDSYQPSLSPITGYGTEFADTWQLTGVSGSLDSRADVQIIENPDGEGNIIKQRSFFTYNWYSGHPSITPTDVTFEDNAKYKVKFDFSRANNDLCVGLRFRNADGTWRALYFAGRSDKTYTSTAYANTYYSTVVLDGQLSSADRVKNTSENPTEDEDFVSIVKTGSISVKGRDVYYVNHNNGVWYTVEADIEEGILTWSVKNRDSGDTVQTGVYKSSEAIINKNTFVELFAGGANNNYVYFDNFEVSSYTNYIPMKACINLISGQNISSANTIRFNQLAGGYVAAINCPTLALQTVGLSEDGASYTNVTLDENGIWNPEKDVKKYTHIKLPVSAIPDDLKVYGDMGVDGGDLIYREPFEIYAVKDGVNAGTITTGTVTDDSVVSFENGVLTGLTNGGTTNVSFRDSERRVRDISFKIVDVLSLLEAADDTEAIAAYVSAQQPVLNVLNTAIANGDTSAVDEFFSSTEETDTLNAITCMDGAPFRELKATEPDKYAAFINRIMTHTDGFACSSLVSEIRGIENTFKKESAVGNIENLASGAEVMNALDANNDTLGLKLDSFYETYKTEICDFFVNTQFANHADLNKKLSEKTVLVTTANCINPTLIAQLMDDYPDEIGYDKTHYSAITNKTAFGNAYAAVKDTLTDIDKIKTFVDSYTVPTATPTPTKKPQTITGGGGGGHTTSYIDTKDKNAATPAPGEPAPTVKPAVEEQEIYEDVPVKHWGYEAIRYLDARGAVEGYDDGSFKPEKCITRAEFIKILVNAFGQNTETTEDYESPFEDLDKDAWYFDSMAQAQLLGIVNGTDGLCRPNDNITRQELAVMTYRMAEAVGKTFNRNTDADKFTDEASIADWAKTIVLKLQVAGVISGTDGKFMPNDETTRAMAAQILYKAMSSFEKPAEGEGV